MAATDQALAKSRQVLVDRMDELRPTVDEFHQLEETLAKFPGTSKPKRRRKAEGITRPDEFVKLVERSPGIGVTEAAAKMGIQPNYLYRVAKDLTDEGRIVKRDTAYFPPESGKTNHQAGGTDGDKDVEKEQEKALATA